MLTSKLLFLALIHYLTAACSADSLVPVLGWSNSDTLSSAPLTSNPPVDQLLKDVPFDTLDVAIVLKASKLSFDDIAKYGGVYGEINPPLSSLHSLLSSSKSTISTGLSGLPASDITNYLSFAMNTEPLYISGLNQFPELGGSRKHVIVVQLPEGGDEEEMFRTHNQLITDIVSSLSSFKKPYMMVYTSDHSTDEHRRVLQAVKEYRRSAEPLRENIPVERLHNVTGDDSVCYRQRDANRTCLLFCFTNPEIKFARMQGKNITTKASTLNDSLPVPISGSCDTNLTGQFNDMDIFGNDTRYSYIAFNVSFRVDNTTDDPFDRAIVFAFATGSCKESDGGYNSTRCGFWTLKVVSGDSGNNLTEFLQFKPERVFSKINIPLISTSRSIVSYACGNNSLNKFQSYDVNGSVESYQFYGIQVQPYASLTENRGMLVFGSAYNCQGYFGPVTWMGVLSMLILILILYIAVVFVFSINTIDRFDDPRGSRLNIDNLH